jgi:hypothetical protein
MGKGGSVSGKERAVMVEDAPANAGAVSWPSPQDAADAVRRMQTKLHQWAREDSVRCFDEGWCSVARLVSR